MMRSVIQKCLAVSLVWLGLALCSPVMAEEKLHQFSSGRTLHGPWSLNAAGQLQVWFDPLHNGRYEVEERYTVILNDPSPKLCGDPDGTGRHTWFFTDALLIDVVPVRSQSTPFYPSSPEGELAERER